MNLGWWLVDDDDSLPQPIFYRHYPMSGRSKTSLPEPWDFAPIVRAVGHQLGLRETEKCSWDGMSFRLLLLGSDFSFKKPSFFLLLARMAGPNDLVVEIYEVERNDPRIPR